jgi:hypothetical protein
LSLFYRFSEAGKAFEEASVAVECSNQAEDKKLQICQDLKNQMEEAFKLAQDSNSQSSK